MGDEDRDFDVLPVTEYKSQIVDAIRKNQVLICISETGSGKTTQIPQFCLDNGLLGSSSMIAITQPRRVAAITVAHRVAEERHSRVGSLVGYSVRFDEQTSASTRIKYMTDGILLRECLSSPDLPQYSVIMLDEAHERSINTDVLFGLVKGTCARRPDLRVIVTSATLDVDKFAAYFNDCPVVRVPGRVFPVDIYHSKTRQVMTASGPASGGYVQAAVDAVLSIHRGDEEGHVLVFLTGQEEVERACRLLRQAVAAEPVELRTNRQLVVLPLYAALSAEQQKAVFRKLPPPPTPSNGSKVASLVPGKAPRKCIFATNIAETSITVPHVRFVVDSGYTKQKTFDPARAMESLVVVPVSRVASDQRAGRAGRTAPGSCYRLYSSECYENMLPETVPEILRSSLGSTVLYLKALGVVDALAFDFIERPDADQVAEALLWLHMLGAIDARGALTDAGRCMSKLPLEPAVGRMVVAAADRNCDCLSAMVSVAAVLSTETVFVRPSHSQLQSQQQLNRLASLSKVVPKDSHKHSSISSSYSHSNQYGKEGVDARAELAHARLCHPLGDHHTYLRVYREYVAAGVGLRSVRGGDDERRHREEREWCEANFISHRAMKNAVRIRDQLWSEVRAAGLVPTHLNNSIGRGHHDGNRTTISEDSALSMAVATALYGRAARLCAGNDTVYRSLPFGPQLERGGGLMATRLDAEGAEVTLLVPTGSSALSMGPHPPPQCVVYHDLVVGGRATMRHICAVDGVVLGRLRVKYTPIGPLQLCGRPVDAPSAAATVLSQSQTSSATLKRSRPDDTHSEQSPPGSTHTPSTVVSDEGRIRASAAKERFLARKGQVQLPTQAHGKLS